MFHNKFQKESQNFGVLVLIKGSFVREVRMWWGHFESAPALIPHPRTHKTRSCINKVISNKKSTRICSLDCKFSTSSRCLFSQTNVALPLRHPLGSWRHLTTQNLTLTTRIVKWRSRWPRGHLSSPSRLLMSAVQGILGNANSSPFKQPCYSEFISW